MQNEDNIFLSLRDVGGINSTNAYDIHGDSEYEALKACLCYDRSAA